MMRLAIRLEELAECSNLLLATWKAARGKASRSPVARFLADLERNLDALAESILAEKAPVGRASRFVTHDPKRRVIHAACFADRVLHHAILNRAEPRFETMLVDSSYACRPGKGVHAAVAAVQRGLRAWPWFVQVDVDGYFPSIRHHLLLELLARRFKGAGFLNLLVRIVERGASNGAGRGLPIGTLTSQHFANAFLDSADRLLLAHPGCGAHVRYMDYIFWGCASRVAAEDSLAALSTHLRDERELRLKARVRVARSAEGLHFCGFRVRQGVILPSGRKMARFRAAVARVEAARGAALVSELETQCAWDASLCHPHGLHERRFQARCAGGIRVQSGVGMPVDMKKSPARRARRFLEQRAEEAPLCLPQPEAARHSQRQPGLSLLPELDGFGGLDGQPLMDQTARPAGEACLVSEPQGARGASRRGRPPPPSAPRVAASACPPHR